MSKLAKNIIMLSDSFAIKKNMVDEVNKKLKSFRDNPGDLDLNTMCELENILREQLFVISTLTKKQLRKIKLDQLNKICEKENIVWTTFNSNENKWYNFA